MPQIKHKTLTLFTLYFTVFLNAFGYFLIFPALSNLIFSHHSFIPAGWARELGNYLFPTVLASGTLGSLVFAPIMGRLSDRFGRKIILIYCALFTALSFLFPILALYSGSVLLFLIGNTLNGMASNGQGIAQAAISDISNQTQRKTFRFAVDTSIICLAMSTGPFAGALLSNPTLSHHFTASTPFLFAIILTLISLGLLFIALPETHQNIKLNPNKKWPGFLKSFSDIIKLPKYIIYLLLVCLLIQSAWAQFFQYIYIYFPEKFGWSTEHISLYTTLLGAYLIFGLLIILPLMMKKLSHYQIIFISILISLLSFIGLSIFGPLGQWIFAPPLAIGIGLYFPCLLTIFSNYAGENNQGWIMNLNRAIMGISWLITGFGAIYLSQFNMRLPIIASIILMLGAGVVFGTLKKR